MKNSKTTYCHLPWSYLYLRYGGRIQPCCQNSTELGNVNNKNFKFQEVWNGEKLQQIRKLISENQYEQAGCSSECNVIHSLKYDGEVDLFNQDMIEMSKKNSLLKKNFLEFNSNIIKKHSIISNMPLQLDIQPLEACNMACTMCHQNHTNSVKLDNSSIKKIITPNLKTIYSIRLQGGEVFLNNTYKDLLLELKENTESHQIIHVITNGSLLSIDDLNKMTRGDNPIHFSISSDGINEYTFKKIRNSSHFYKVMHNIKYLSEIQKKKDLDILTWNFVVMKSNFYQIKELIQISVSLKIKINIQTIIGEYKDENIFRYNLLDNEKSFNYLNEAIDLSKKSKANIIGLEVIKQKLTKVREY